MSVKKNIGIGRAHSKIILVGEHSVVYGYPAIAIPIKNIKVTCIMKESKKILKLSSNDMISVAISIGLKYMGIKEAYIDYKINSQIPSKRGMGSSAAVSIAVVRALFDYYNFRLNYRTLTFIVNEAEKVAHGNPSGLDGKTCMSRKAIKFIKNKGFNTINFKLNSFLIIADTGIYGKTKEAVDKVKKLDNEFRSNILQNLGKITENIEQNIKYLDIKKLGSNMIKAHNELKKLGISCEKSDELVEEAIKAGAMGAKITGGGLGGCIIALAKNYEESKKIVLKLREKGAIKIWIQRI